MRYNSQESDITINCPIHKGNNSFFFFNKNSKDNYLPMHALNLIAINNQSIAQNALNPIIQII